MQGRTVSWPAAGDRATFRRRLAVLLATGGSVVAGAVAVAALLDPTLLQPLLPLAGSTLLLMLLWTHGSARAAARRAELEQSFAGLTVLHHGAAYAVADRSPVIGEYATRRDAARAAMDRGSWALVVRAWDRYFLLAAAPAPDLGERRPPVSFRSRAVADVVPAIGPDAAALGA